MLQDKVALATMAATELGKVAPLHRRIGELGADPFEAMAPFSRAIDEFHRHTAPSDWLEGLVKAFVGDGLADDFYREIAAFLDPVTRDLVETSMDEDGGHAAFVVDRVRAAITADPRVAGRLALWGRRIMGEALTQAQRVAVDRDSLTALLTGGVDRPGLDLAALGRMFTRLTERHAARMSELGLDS
ncbi:MAG: hydroxylase [Humibacillus sp.]|nr:hydroxylase [Humibacillus sp.]